jgi:hypothetical protein
LHRLSYKPVSQHMLTRCMYLSAYPERMVGPRGLCQCMYRLNLYKLNRLEISIQENADSAHA